MIENILKEIVSDYTSLFGDDLQSVVLYGSAARGEYVEKKSDINTLMMLSDEGIEQFHKANDLVKKWQKKKVAIPLFMTSGFIRESLDSFPIEFLNITSHYKVEYGVDPFENIELKRNDIRLQLEHEMKGKLLNLRQAFFQASGSHRDAAMLVQDSFGSFLSLFPAILYLKEEEVSSSTTENIRKIASLFDLDTSILEKLYRIKKGAEKLAKSEAVGLLKSYTTQIRALALQTDNL